jgi:hypothetical protein
MQPAPLNDDYPSKASISRIFESYRPLLKEICLFLSRFPEFRQALQRRIRKRYRRAIADKLNSALMIELARKQITGLGAYQPCALGALNEHIPSDDGGLKSRPRQQQRNRERR